MANSKKPVSKGKKKDVLSTAEDKELALIQQALPDVYHPKNVNRALVTMDEVTDILRDVPLGPVAAIESAIESTKNQPAVKVSLSDEVLDSGIISGMPMTEVHRAVLDAVLSQMDAGNPVFTPAMVYRTMTGKDSGTHVSASRAKMVDDIIKQLMFTPLHINMEALSSGGEVVNGTLDGPILPGESITINISGASCKAYKLTGVPIIYRFCNATRSLSVTPLNLLAIDMNYSDRNIMLLNVLQRKIAPLLYPVDREYVQPAPLVFSYQNIFDTVLQGNAPGKETSMQTTTARMRAIIATILDTWVKKGFLSEWEELTEGRNKVGCRLHFPKQAPPKVPLNLEQLEAGH